MNPSNKPTLNGKNATFTKLNSWMNTCSVNHFSFCNTFQERKVAKKEDVDSELLLTVSHEYDKIITLGNFASDALKRLNIKHFKLPHPSPRNRMLNDKNFEKLILTRCKEFIHG